MGHELEGIKTDFVDAGRVLNRMHLRDGLGHRAWLVPCLITSVQRHTMYIAYLIFWRR